MIAAGENQAWILDKQGNLTHCKLDECSSSSLRKALPQVKWNRTASDLYPGLAVTQNNRIWIVQGNVWWSDGGGAWQPVDAFRKARLISAARDRVWVQDEGVLAAIAMEGTVAIRQTIAQLEWPPDARILGVADAGRTIMIASASGLVEGDGQVWHKTPGPAEGRVYRGAAFASDGALWLIAAGRSSGVTRVLLLVVFLAITLLLLWWFVKYQFRYMAKSAAAERQEVQDILPDALKQPPPAMVMPAGLGKWLIAAPLLRWVRL